MASRRWRPWQATDTLRLKGGLAYTRAVFREGVFAGNDIPLVSRWTGSAGVSWNIVQKELVSRRRRARYFGPRRMDNDSANLQLLIPGATTVDLRIGGEYRNMFWSVSVQNLFDVHYYEYAISSLDFIHRAAGVWYLQRLSAARTDLFGEGGAEVLTGP